MKKLLQSGDVYVWLTGVSVMFSLLMIFGLLFLILAKGLGFFWPSDVVKLQLKNGDVYLGQYAGREVIPSLTENNEKEKLYRTRIRIGNRDIYGLDFKWIDDADVESRSFDKSVVVLERLEWGNFYGFIKEINMAGTIINQNDPDLFKQFKELIHDSDKIKRKIKKIEKKEIGDINYNIEKSRLKIKGMELSEENDPEKLNKYKNEIVSQEALFENYEKQLTTLNNELNENKLTITSIDGYEKVLPIGAIVRFFKPNSMGTLSKTGFYISKIWEFVSENPREANTEGGVFPAIFGTILMVLLMSVVVMPFGILAALYLREYAKQGAMVRLVRICVNNLAGVPSIVFGVFGVGFFLYGIGGLIDAVFFKEALPSPTYGTGGILWASLTLALLTVPVVIVATEEGLAAVPKNIKDGSLALGATKFETVWKVVLPTSLPAILTGLILAIARACGEVAPLMITGVVKLAPELPIDGRFPFLHLERKFMHLGFHIYDVGFQSPNVEAAKPMVYTTALLLILIVIMLNLVAIVVRSKLRKKYMTSAV